MVELLLHVYSVRSFFLVVVVLCLFPLSLVNIAKKKSADSRIELKIRQGNKFIFLGHRCFCFCFVFCTRAKKALLLSLHCISGDGFTTSVKICEALDR